jgi:hypothetical protein
MKMNLRKIIEAQGIEVEKIVVDFLKSKEGQSLLKKTIIFDIKEFLRDATIDDILSSKTSKRYYDAIEKAVIKRLSL